MIYVAVIKIKHAVDVVTETVNFIRERALNHRQSDTLFEEHGSKQADLG